MSGAGTERDRVLTLPNALSLVRLLGVPVFLWLLATGRDGAAILVLVLGGFSDYLDGVLARRWGQVTRVGQLLDPVADRLYILAALVALGYRGLVPWVVVGLLVLRDTVLAGSVVALRRRHLPLLEVSRLGKAATALLLMAFPLVLLGEAGGTLGEASQVAALMLLLAGTTLYLWSGGQYLRAALRAVRSEEARPPSREGGSGNGARHRA